MATIKDLEIFSSTPDRESLLDFFKKFFAEAEAVPLRIEGFSTDAVENFFYVGRAYADKMYAALALIEFKDKESLKNKALQKHLIEYFYKYHCGGVHIIVAFVAKNSPNWKLSFVELYPLDTDKEKSEKIKWGYTITSYECGPDQKVHTLQSRFLPFLGKKIETAQEFKTLYSVENVTEEFYKNYRDLFIKTKTSIDNILKEDENVRKEFKEKNINSVEFSRKLLGQITFLYFLQKKGWFGVEPGRPWGSGPKDFLRRLYNKEYKNYDNFYNDVLEPLLYEALKTNREDTDFYYANFNCKIPFLNGGLFEPIGQYDWVGVPLQISNDLFSNSENTGILDVFDRYNFTVVEEDALDKEVALDPELLGKIYEKLNAVNESNFAEFVDAVARGESKEEEFNKKYGVFYTPRSVVEYMCQKAIINYLLVKKEDRYTEEDVVSWIQGQEITDNIKKNSDYIDNLLETIKVCDPGVGSGAFPIGLMHLITKLRTQLTEFVSNKENRSNYIFKRDFLEKSLYAVDIDQGATEMCKLRAWLSLVVDEEDFSTIKPLPNLDYKIVRGDSLLKIDKDLFNSEKINTLEKLKVEYFNETKQTKKNSLKGEILDILKEISNNHLEFDFNIYFAEVFKNNGGFDVVIGNPPYVSVWTLSEEAKNTYTKLYKFRDDLYNYFFHRGMEILKEDGILVFITPSTFWTISSKENLRNLLLENTLVELVDSGNPFPKVSVQTSITIVRKKRASDGHKIRYVEAQDDITHITLDTYVEQKKYVENFGHIFFKPSDRALKMFEKYAPVSKKLLDEWWHKIYDVQDYKNHIVSIKEYNNSLKEHEITLLGLLAPVASGVSTKENCFHIGVLEGTESAERVKKQRPQKLLLIKDFCEENNIKSLKDAEKFLNDKKEKEIRVIFDNIVRKYGLGIFGRGWLYRIVSKDEVYDVDNITQEQIYNGIEGDKTYVPMDKGNPEGEKWYFPSIYYIDWGVENVNYLRNSGKATLTGLDYAFKEGICCNLIGPLKATIKTKTIHEVSSSSIFPYNSKFTKYLVCLLNSTFIFNYKNAFINNTVNNLPNDLRQIPVVIPSELELQAFNALFDRAYKTQKEKYEKKIPKEEAEKTLEEIQVELDKMVEELYS